MMPKHLKGKTDAECRQLAGHYLARALKAEKANGLLRSENSRLMAENSRLVGLARDMTEGRAALGGQADD